jgi:hypothetical protein
MKTWEMRARRGGRVVHPGALDKGDFQDHEGRDREAVSGDILENRTRLPIRNSSRINFRAAEIEDSKVAIGLAKADRRLVAVVEAGIMNLVLYARGEKDLKPVGDSLILLGSNAFESLGLFYA